MRKNWLGPLGALLAGAGLALAQPGPLQVARRDAPLLATPLPRRVPGPMPTQLPPLPDDPNSCCGTAPELFPLPVCELPAPEELPPPPRKDPREGKPRVWVSGEPLLWWVRPGTVPPLLTAGGPGTALLFGNDNLDYDLIFGGRVAAGLTNACGNLGLEGNGFLMSDRRLRFLAGSAADGTPALARPFTNARTGTPTAALVSLPGALAGGIDISSSSELWGAESNVVASILCRDHLGIDLLGGFRYLNLDEDLSIAQSTALLGNGVAWFGGTPVSAPATLGVADSFRTRSQFYGGQLGTQVELRWRRLYTHLVGKAAFGAMHEVVDVRGATSLTGPAGTTTLPGGLLAVASNIGRQKNNEFAVVPEVNLNLGVQLTPGVRLYAGYSFLYLSDVVRPGDQVGTTVNPALVPTSPLFGSGDGPAQPAAPLTRTDFWAQGINFGLAFRY